MHIALNLPTLSSIARYEAPYDQITGGIGQLVFLRDDEDTSSQEGIPGFNGCSLFAWNFQGSEMLGPRLDFRMGSPELPGMPAMYKLLTDPKDNDPLDKIDLTEAWFMPFLLEQLGEFPATLAEEPPNAPGTHDPQKSVRLMQNRFGPMARLMTAYPRTPPCTVFDTMRPGAIFPNSVQGLSNACRHPERR